MTVVSSPGALVDIYEKTNTAIYSHNLVYLIYEFNRRHWSSVMGIIICVIPSKANKTLKINFSIYTLIDLGDFIPIPI